MYNPHYIVGHSSELEIHHGFLSQYYNEFIFEKCFELKKKNKELQVYVSQIITQAI
jgi:hypothetical protein